MFTKNLLNGIYSTLFLRVLFFLIIIGAGTFELQAQMIDPLTTLYQTAPDKFREDAVRIYDRAMNEMELKLRALEERAVKDSIVSEVDSARMRLPFIYLLLEQERELAKNTENAYELLPKGALYFAVDSLHQNINSLIHTHNRSISLSNIDAPETSPDENNQNEAGDTLGSVSYDDLPDPESNEVSDIPDGTLPEETSSPPVEESQSGRSSITSMINIILFTFPLLLFIILLFLLFRLQKRVDGLTAENNKLDGLVKKVQTEADGDSSGGSFEEYAKELDSISSEQKRISNYFTEKISRIERTLSKTNSEEKTREKDAPRKISKADLDNSKVTRAPVKSEDVKFSSYESADMNEKEEEQLHKMTVESGEEKTTGVDLQDENEMAPSLYEEFNNAAVSGLNKQQFFMKKVKRFSPLERKGKENESKIGFTPDSAGDYFIGKDASGTAEVFITFSYPFDRAYKREQLEQIYEIITQQDLGRHIKITDPAIVEQVDGAWQLQQKGRIIVGKKSKRNKGFTWR